jgi:hypothetical protein
MGMDNADEIDEHWPFACPPELLYAAIKANDEFLQNETPENRLKADNQQEKVWLASELAIQLRLKEITVYDIVLAATGVIGFKTDDDGTVNRPLIYQTRIVPEVRAQLETNVLLQEIINEYLLAHFGQILDFSKTNVRGGKE